MIPSQEEIDDFNAKYEKNNKDQTCTKLHFAAQINNDQIGELLISKEIDINVIDIIYLNIIILFLINII